MADDQQGGDFKPATVAMDVRIEVVFKTALAIAATGHSDEFLRMCGENGWSLTARPEFINYVKTFLGEKPVPDAYSITAKAVRGSGSGCFPHTD